MTEASQATSNYTIKASTATNGVGRIRWGSEGATEVGGAYTGKGGVLEAAPPEFFAREANEDVPLRGGGDYLDLVAKPHLEAELEKLIRGLDPESRRCGCWSLVGQCANGHGYAKKLYCGREWCKLCGQQVHNRRIARWLPKVQQLEGMGYLVVTFPEEVLPVMRRKRVWSLVGRRIASILRQEGFSRGLRRWHWFGDQDHDFRPHLNLIVEGKYLRGAQLERLKDRVRRAALRKPLSDAIGKDCVVHYSYTTQPGKMFHILRYVTRATFLEREWDQGIANELWNFRNSLWWGKWKDGPKWHTQGREKEAVVAMLEQGFCPKCGEPIKWGSEPVDSIWLMIWGAREIGGGYYELPDDRGPPGE